MAHYGEKKKCSSCMARDSKNKKSKGTHTMPDGTVMSGSTHTKDSKPVKKGGKGSKEMKEKMARLRAMRGRKKK